MIRHLVLAGRIAGTEEFLKFITKNFPKDTYVNLMDQYRPKYRASEIPELARRLQRSEFAEAGRRAEEYGIQRLAC